MLSSPSRTAPTGSPIGRIPRTALLGSAPRQRHETPTRQSPPSRRIGRSNRRAKQPLHRPGDSDAVRQNPRDAPPVAPHRIGGSCAGSRLEKGAPFSAQHTVDQTSRFAFRAPPARRVFTSPSARFPRSHALLSEPRPAVPPRPSSRLHKPTIAAARRRPIKPPLSATKRATSRPILPPGRNLRTLPIHQRHRRQRTAGRGRFHHPRQRQSRQHRLHHQRHFRRASPLPKSRRNRRARAGQTGPQWALDDHARMMGHDPPGRISFR